MKLLVLNIWGGYIRSPLLEFMRAYRNYDIFCFQEVYHNAQDKIADDDKMLSLNIFSELQDILSEHQGFFQPVVGETYGLGMFIKKNIEVVNQGYLTIHENPHYAGRGPAHSRNLQWVNCRVNQRDYYVLNVHGLWNGQGKTDSPERLVQSEKIRAFLDTIRTPKILCGDLNLRPDTNSIKMLENGMNNLIRLHNVRSTRTSLYPKEEKFADYIFTSPEININKFEVLKNEVSDHAPLFLDFH